MWYCAVCSGRMATNLSCPKARLSSAVDSRRAVDLRCENKTLNQFIHILQRIIDFAPTAENIIARAPALSCKIQILLY